MQRDELLDELTGDILAYVMHGGFPERKLASELRPEGVDERFEDFEMLVRLHFILREDVVDFVEALPKRLRNISTQTENVSRTTRGGISGRINWSATHRERYSSNPRDTALFVTENRTESYDTDENVVLKRLLAVIYETLVECREYLARDYQWVNERWRAGRDLIESMSDIFERNVHVRRIRDPESYEPTERMLERAAASRDPIYREAATLVRTYQRTVDGEPEELLELLDRTSITPDDDETLFELFVLFRFIETIESLRSQEFVLRTIESGSQEVARLTSSDAEIVLYHDSSANDRDLSFRPVEPSKETDELSRSERVKREAREVLANYFGRTSRPVYTKRPDVIVLEVRGDVGNEYLVTEVKNSTRQETIHRGIEETLEYLAFLRQDEEFVFEEDTGFFGSGWNGLLVVQDLGEETLALEDQGDQPIRILQASEIPSKLRDVLERVVT